MFSDNGGEYIKLTPSLLQHGISHLTSPPHTPQHNGYAERRHRHIVETGLSLLTHANLPTSFWPKAFATAVYLINRLPTPTLHNESPYFRLFKSQPNYQKLRAFGCLCYPWLKPYTSNKLAPKSAACIFFGYSLSQSAYFCFDPATRRLYTSRHVTFVETEFPYPQLSSHPCSTPAPHLDDWCTSPISVLPSPARPTPVTSPPHSPPPVSPTTEPAASPNSPSDLPSPPASAPASPTLHFLLDSSSSQCCNSPIQQYKKA